MRGLFVAFLGVVLPACAPRPVVPMPTQVYPPAQRQAEPAALFVMLHGRGDTKEVFETHGFIESLQQRLPHAEVVTADAHFGYYRSRTILDRLDEDILQPARSAGVDTIYIVGASMGGLGALLAARRFPDDIDGVVLFAPYLGRPAVLAEVDAAGGLATWTPAPGEGSWDYELWRFLKQETHKDDGVPIFLLFGREDRGARAHRLLATALPPERVFETDGGHALAVWARQWSQFPLEDLIGAP